MADKDKSKSLGEMITQLRKGKKLSYQDIEKRGIIPAQLVEDIEKGMVGPSIGALKKICKALEIPLSEFFQKTGLSEKDLTEEETGGDAVVVRKDKRQTLSVKGSRAVIESCIRPSEDCSLELLWQEVEPKSSGGDWLTHPGEECCLIMQGRIRLHVEGSTYELEEGDTLWYKTTKRHKWENPYEKPAIMLWAITPPYHSKM